MDLLIVIFTFSYIYDKILFERRGYLMEKIINGKKVMAQVLGGFQIEERGKKYIICSFDEEIDKKNNLIMIYEVDENENIVSIPDNEKELVLKFYNNFKNEIIGGNGNE